MKLNGPEGSGPLKGQVAKAPATGAPLKQAPAAATTPTDRLKLEGPSPASVGQALAAVEGAKLPPLPLLRFFDAKRDAWVREGSQELMKAHKALQLLEKAQLNPLTALPEARLQAARAKVEALAKELAAGDTNGVRHAACAELRQATHATVRLGVEVPQAPLKGNLDAKAWGEAKSAWFQKQSQEIQEARQALGEVEATEALLHLDLGSNMAMHALSQAEGKLKSSQQDGDVVSGLKALVQLGTALVQVHQAQQGIPVGPVVIQEGGRIRPRLQ